MPEPGTIHTRIEEDRKNSQAELSRWSDLRIFRRYYRGRQRGTLNADQMRILQGVIGNKFAHNICKKIVNTKAHRLEMARWDVDNQAVVDFLFQLWTKNQVPDLFADMVVACIRDGNTCIGLNWVPSSDGGRVGLFLERWWDGQSGMFVHYDSYGQPDYAVKEWKTPNNQKYRTIYFPDRLERYQSIGEGWSLYSLPGDPLTSTSGILPWVKGNGKPLGIPVIHFPNGNDDDTNYGASELDGGVLGFQDQINAIQHDITAVSLLTGSPRTTSKGFALEEDDDGKKKMPKTGPGAHWHADDPTAEWGILEPGQVGPLKEGLMIKVDAVCQMTNIPVHAITGDWPSGEAIFRSEMGLVNDGEKLAKKVGPAMSSVAHRATEMANAFGSGPQLDEEALIRTIFAPLDKRDPLTLVMFAEKTAPFVSEQEVLRILGYAPEKILEILAEREAEAAAAIERQQALMASGAFGGGLNGNDNPDEDQDPEEDPIDD